MSTLMIVFAIMLLLVAAMSIGVLLGRKPLAGSCGGMSAVGMDGACDVCGGDKSKCEKESAEAAKKAGSADFYDASK